MSLWKTRNSSVPASTHCHPSMWLWKTRNFSLPSSTHCHPSMSLWKTRYSLTPASIHRQSCQPYATHRTMRFHFPLTTREHRLFYITSAFVAQLGSLSPNVTGIAVSSMPCHYGNSHSAVVTFPPLIQPKEAGTRLSDPGLGGTQG